MEAGGRYGAFQAVSLLRLETGDGWGYVFEYSAGVWLASISFGAFWGGGSWAIFVACCRFGRSF